MTYDDDVAKLTIAEVYGEDSGEYICAAVNDAGNAQTSCDIIVKGGQITCVYMRLLGWL